MSLLTRQEAAAALHVSERTLRRLIAKGYIRETVVSPRKRMIDTADLAAYVASSKRRAA